MSLPPSNLKEIGLSVRGSIAKHLFLVMQNYGRHGLEAVVNPETTRRGMIERIVSGEDRDIAYILEVRDYGDGQPIITTDITKEVMGEVDQIKANAMEPA